MLLGPSPRGSLLPPHTSLPGSCPRARRGAHCSGLFLGHCHWWGVGGVFLILTLSFCQRSKKILYLKFFQCLAMCLTSTKESGHAWGGGWMHHKIITALGATGQPVAAPPLRVGVEIREGVGYFTHDGGRAALVAQW